MSIVRKDTEESAMLCKICNGPSHNFGTAEVLRKYRVRYFRCEVCGFMQTETPYWLEEAYSSAIATLDVGIIRRNIQNCTITAAVLNLLFPKTSSAIDFGAGHGILVRMMRDKGYNFFWSDLHATNDYARGFEYQTGKTCDFLCAFEVLEHLTDPISDLAKLMSLSENVLVSTCLLPNPAPALPDWWYYVPTTGQHVAFYTKESLQLLAIRFERHLLSFGPYHLFTKERQNGVLFRMATKPRIAALVNAIRQRASLTESDFHQLTM